MSPQRPGFATLSPRATYQVTHCRAGHYPNLHVAHVDHVSHGICYNLLQFVGEGKKKIEGWLTKGIEVLRLDTRGTYASHVEGPFGALKGLRSRLREQPRGARMKTVFRGCTTGEIHNSTDAVGSTQCGPREYF